MIKAGKTYALNFTRDEKLACDLMNTYEKLLGDLQKRVDAGDPNYV